MSKIQNWHYKLLLSPLIGLLLLAIGLSIKGYISDILSIKVVAPFIISSVVLYLVLLITKKHLIKYFIIGGIIPTQLASCFMVFMIFFRPESFPSVLILFLIPAFGIALMPIGILTSYIIYRLNKKDKNV